MSDLINYEYWCGWDGYCEYCDVDTGRCKYKKPCEHNVRISEYRDLEDLIAWHVSIR